MATDQRGRRRFASSVLPVGVLAIVVGWLLAGGGSTAHTIGVCTVGFGIGISVAAVCVLLGLGPQRRR